MIFLIFGDSVAYGCWDEEGGWVSRLRGFVDKKVIASDFEYYAVVYNQGITLGVNSNDILAGFERETKSRILDNKDISFIFAVGVNDSSFINKEGRFMVSPEQFRTNIQKITQKAKKFSSKIVFLGLAPVDEAKVDPSPWCQTNSYRNEFVKKYNGIISSVCLKNKVDFIEIFGKFMRLDYKKLLIDGVHPNTQGHELIFEIIKDDLIKKKII